MFVKIVFLYWSFIQSATTTEAVDSAGKRRLRFGGFGDRSMRRFLRPMKLGMLYDVRNDKIIENNFKCKESSTRKLCPNVDFKEIWKPQSIGVLASGITNGKIGTESQLQKEEDDIVPLDDRLSIYAGLIDPSGGYGSWFERYKYLIPGMKTITSKFVFTTERTSLGRYLSIFECCDGAVSYAEELGATHYVGGVVYGNIGIIVYQTPEDIINAYNIWLMEMARKVYFANGTGDSFTDRESEALEMSKIQVFSDLCPGIGGEYIKPEVLMKCMKDVFSDDQSITYVELVPIEFKNNKIPQVYQISKDRAEKVESMVRSLFRAEHMVNLENIADPKTVGVVGSGGKLIAFRADLLKFINTTLSKLKDILPRARVDAAKEAELDELIATWNSSKFSAEKLDAVVTQVSEHVTVVEHCIKSLEKATILLNAAGQTYTISGSSNCRIQSNVTRLLNTKGRTKDDVNNEYYHMICDRITNSEIPIESSKTSLFGSSKFKIADGSKCTSQLRQFPSVIFPADSNPGLRGSLLYYLMLPAFVIFLIT